LLEKLAGRIFGTKKDREEKRIRPVLDEINSIQEGLVSLSDDELRAKTDEFRSVIRERVGALEQELEELKERMAREEDEQALADSRLERENLERRIHEEEEDVLREITPEAFAVVKDAARRLVGQKWQVCEIETEWEMVPFDVQLLGAVILHEGKIAEMATGEGKTLVATMPLYLNALTGKGAHLVTVNDYLARRDREWMGRIYEFLGLTVGCIQTGMSPEERKAQYACDITYGTNNEFGFDYLRDNMTQNPDHRVQRGYHYAIVDEVDSVLVDEARTPLIISGPVEHSTQEFDRWKKPVAELVHKQTLLVNRTIAEAEALLAEGKEDEAGVKLLLARRGAPRNKRLSKVLKETGIQKLVERTEMEYRRDKKLNELDEELFYNIDERSNVVDLSEEAKRFISPGKDPDFFTPPDLSTELKRIDENDSLSPRERAVEKRHLYEKNAEKVDLNNTVRQLLRAHALFEKDVEYVVQDERVVIVDEFTGRLMTGRRYSDGLHEAIEAKENVKVGEQTQTFATITLQNYFRMYDKLAGMTGTAETEAHEFWEIYKLDVVVIRTNEPVRRIDYDDVIYKTRREKYNAVIDEIDRMHQAGRPVLVGTVSVEVSETLSRMLSRKGIEHSVLNAKHHQREAEIVAHAGGAGRVTIATNMAGRGTDIKLGSGVVKCSKCCYICEEKTCDRCDHENMEEACREDMPCGLHIIGTERHESRRIDRQLRGRSGRQGDPGSSRFYLSLEDNLMRLFGSDRIAGVMDRLGVNEGEAIHHPLVTRAISGAQRRVEMFNFDIRKRLLEYDDVMNEQRTEIYRFRNEILDSKNPKGRVLEIFEQLIDEIAERHTDKRAYSEEWDWDGLREELIKLFLLDLEIPKDRREGLDVEELRERLRDAVKFAYTKREEVVGEEQMRELERNVMLHVVDSKWRDNLYELDALKEGIHLRAYAHKDPLVEYKTESFALFRELKGSIFAEIAALLFRIDIRPLEEREEAEKMRAYKPGAASVAPAQAEEDRGEGVLVGAGVGRRSGAKRERVPEATVTQYRREEKKIGRNDPCPCGSGKKYKKCCGRDRT
jgi:preprotein translocase subunit SecA